MHRTHPGGVDQADPGIQQRGVQPGGHPDRSQAVARVGLLGDEAGQPVELVVLLAAVGELDHQTLLASLQHCGNRGERKHADGQHLPANQRVDQAGLAAFELADHGHLQPQGPQPTRRLGSQVRHVGHADSSRCLRQGRQRPI
jgi:hypothetical protein